MISLNAAAPDFTAKTTRGEEFRLSDHRGKIVVLYFFPKAFTPGWTKEASQFGNAYEELKAMGAEVVGISTDDHQTQCEFAASVKANFPMIGDPDGSIARAFDVFWPFIKLVRRMTFVIDQQGIVRAVLSHEIRIQAHVDEAVQVVSRLVRKTSADATGTTGKAPVLKS